MWHLRGREIIVPFAAPRSGRVTGNSDRTASARTRPREQGEMSVLPTLLSTRISFRVMALFADNVVVGIVRMVRRESRRRRALGWNIADGRLTRFTTSYGSPTLPLLDYTYQVNGQSEDGSATGMPIRDERINQIGEVLDSLPALRIRYDPTNPRTSRLLNEDNPELPFEIDLLA